MAGWGIARCPSRARTPRKRDVLSTLLLSVLAGHRCYAQVTALRCDAVNPPLLGMSKVISEDALRRALVKIDETAGSRWLGFAEGLGGKREVWEYAALGDVVGQRNSHPGPALPRPCRLRERI
jgi:hypothetical protein